MTPLQKLSVFLKPYWKEVIIGPLLMAIEVAMDLTQPRLMQRIVDVGIAQLKMPVVIRVSVGSKYGAQHSQDWSALAAHIPGLKVVFPVTPYDAKGLMNSALQGTDPVVFFESQRIYDIGEQFHEGGVPEDYYEIPMGEPDVKKEGNDITILTVGATLYRALDAAKTLKERNDV